MPTFHKPINLTAPVLISALILVGVALLSLRLIYFGKDHLATEDSVWKVKISGQFETQSDAIVSIPRPKSGRYYKPIAHRIFHPGFKELTSKKIGKGFVRVKALDAGRAQFISEYHFQLSQTPIRQLSKEKSLSPYLREKYLKQEAGVDLSQALLDKILEEFNKGSETKNELVKKIYLYAQQIPVSTNTEFDHLLNVLQKKRASNLGRAQVMIALCRQLAIPARLVTGFVLEEQLSASPYYWVQVYDESAGWQAYDPEKGFQVALPGNYVAFAYDNPQMFLFTHTRMISKEYLVVEERELLAEIHDEKDRNILYVFDLKRLDVETKNALSMLLVLPFCVLFTAFLRNVVGLYPYGVFAAPLLSLAMVYVDTLMVISMAAIVIFVALLGLTFLPKHLSRPSRLTIVFTVVAMSLVLCTSLFSYYSLSPGGSIILLPTIILVAVIDRFYSYMEKSGIKAATIRLAITFWIAILCLPFVTNEYLFSKILEWPELHFFTIALVLLVSAYRGRRLTDRDALHLLGENKHSKGASKSIDQPD